MLQHKHWNASSDHFPVLERLVLRYCLELKRVPINFANIGTLKLIVLESCYSSLVISANKIEQKLQKREDRKLQVLDLGTKVGMPINEGSKEESVELPDNEWSEAESVKLPNNEICDEVNLEFLSYLSHEEERPKALRKKVMNVLKKKICLTTVAAAADLPHYRRHRHRSEAVIVRKKEVQLQRGTWLPVSLSDITPPAAEGSLKLSYNKEEEAAG
nr:probable disease resistance protein At1g59620 [Ipomoea trifida]